MAMAMIGVRMCMPMGSMGMSMRVTVLLCMSMIVVVIVCMVVFAVGTVLMLMFVLMLVFVLMCVVMMVLGMGAHFTRFAPDADGSDEHHSKHTDAAQQQRQEKLLVEDQLGHAVVVHRDRDESERTDDEDVQQLFREIVAKRIAVMVMIMCHD